MGRVVAVKTVAGSTGSRPAMTVHLRNLTGRIQVHNLRVIAVDGSGSLPAPVDGKTIAPPAEEMTEAANRSWNSISPSSLRVTRLLMSAMVGADMIVATAAVASAV
jgi:hypothetical protein